MLKVTFAAALKLQDKLAPLHINLFVETSPAPVIVCALAARQMLQHRRLPMVPAEREGADRRSRGDGACRLDELRWLSPELGRIDA